MSSQPSAPAGKRACIRSGDDDAPSGAAAGTTVAATGITASAAPTSSSQSSPSAGITAAAATGGVEPASSSACWVPAPCCTVCSQPAADASSLECRGCKQHVHGRCYGIDMSVVAAPRWKCDACQQTAAGSTQACELCLQPGAAVEMRFRRDHGKWVHVICMMYRGIASSPASDGARGCSFCGRHEGQQLACGAEGCTALGHPSCVFKYDGYFGTDVQLDGAGMQVGTRFYCYCKPHSLVKAALSGNSLACTDAKLHGLTASTAYKSSLVPKIDAIRASATGEAAPVAPWAAHSYTDAEKEQMAVPGVRLDRWCMLPASEVGAAEAAAASAAADGGAPAAVVTGDDGSDSTSRPAGRWLQCIVVHTNAKNNLTTVRYPLLGNVEERLPLLADAAPTWVRLAVAATR